MKHSVRFIDKQAAELGFYAQQDKDSYIDMLRRVISELPTHLDKSDERVELFGRIIYDARKIDAINSGQRKLW